MDKNRLKSTADTLKKYMSEYCGCELAAIADAELLIADKENLDVMTDAVISLICRIGVDENFQPNIHGVVLDGCLETLNELRQEKFN